MLAETIQLETLRQRIEDLDYEAGNQSDYLDRGKPDTAQAKKAQESINNLTSQSKALKAELKQLIETVRSQKSEALEEWIRFHAGFLQKIIDDTTAGSDATTRRYVAKTTLEDWEKVRTGEKDYISINWHFLKDYRASVRQIRNGGTSQASKANKAWWQFWK